MHIKNRGILYHKIDRIGITILISSLAFACFGTIWALYLDSIVHNASYVGFLASLFTIISILSYFLLVPIIEKNNKIKLYTLSLLLYVISFILFSELSNLYAIMILGIILAVIGSLRITCIGIIIRDNIRDDSVSKNEGLMYALFNVSWLIGPLIAGFIADKFGLNKVFLFGAGALFLALILFEIFKIKDNRISKKTDRNMWKLFKEFFSSKERIKAYFLAGGNNFWWALIYTYIPIYIINNGLDDLIVGYFLAAVVAPLIISEYYFGKLAGKIGFKKIFTMGFLSLGIISIICFFISNIYWLLGALVLASFSVAMIEPTTEAYFLDLIPKNKRDKFYGPFYTSIDVNIFLGTIVGAVTLLFLPLKYVFVFYGIIMFIFAILSLTIKDIIEKK